jgi:hypothetical protein
MQLTALASHAACQTFLTDRRVESVAVLRSTALRFTWSRMTQSRSSGIPEFRFSFGIMDLPFVQVILKIAAISAKQTSFFNLFSK